MDVGAAFDVNAVDESLLERLGVAWVCLAGDRRGVGSELSEFFSRGWRRGLRDLGLECGPLLFECGPLARDAKVLRDEPERLCMFGDG